MSGTTSHPIPRADDQRPLRVAVMIDLFWSPSAGGHVKFWERVSRAAARRPTEIALDLHFLGDAPGIEQLTPNVRRFLHKPVFSASRVAAISGAPDHTDLARRNPSLASAILDADVLHTTDGFFAFSRTAAEVAARQHLPLVNSLHTDTPRLTRLYTQSSIENLFGVNWFSRLLVNGLAIPSLVAGRMQASLDRHHRQCHYVLGSREDELSHVRTLLGPDRVGILRRGLESDLFDPSRRDRTWLLQHHGIRPETVLVTFVGRLEPSKNLMRVAKALARLLQEGRDLHFLCAGEGSLRAEIAQLLGPRATLTGLVDPDTLGRLYAASDIFVFPSEIEVHPNVVQEAMASGLACLLSAKGGADRLAAHGRTALMVSGEGPDPWAEAIALMQDEPERRRLLAAAATAHAKVHFPSWDKVLEEDLLPVWRRVYGEVLKGQGR